MSLRVLLITPEFYGVEEKIKSVLKESGYEVIWIENKILKFDYHGSNPKLKFLRRIYFFLFFPHIRYIKRELKRIENIRFDIFISINAHIICNYLFRRLKEENPGIFSVLFLWDSFSMYSWTKELKQFNKVYTFDPADSEKYRIELKPNFYLKKTDNSNPEPEFDLFFVGKFSPSRLSAIDKIVSKIENSGIKYFVKLWPAYKIFLHSDLLYKLLNIFQFNSNWVRSYLINFEAVEGLLKREYIITNQMRYKDMQYHLACSNVILDLPFQGQNGYTHRLIEALANGKKVITTNSNIKNESFFNSEQIHIIDEQNPEVDCNWIKERSQFPADIYFANLELSVWLKSIMNVEIA